MCTCVSMRTQDVYFGRTMDLDYSFDEKVVITPRNYPFALKNGENFETWYAMVGMASVSGSYPLYAEATNEKGLSMAGLNFPGNACYDQPVPGKINLTPYEFIPWAMGTFATIADLRRELENVHLIDIPFSKDLPVAELHWMVSDGRQSLVIEQTSSGFHVYDNPTGVLTNNPDFPFHRMNLNNYMNVSCQPAENRFSQQVKLKPYGGGMGAIGLPGDDSPASRFIRASFYKLNSVCGSGDAHSLSQFFHIMEGVSIVRGAVVVSGNTCNMTTYTCCANATRGVYYYRTYANSQLTAVRMTEENKNSQTLTVYELENEQQVKYMN